MTNETLRLLAQIQKNLRNTAERDHNDIIANAASDLAVRLEAVGTAFGMQLRDLTGVDRQLIQYATQHHSEQTG
jgi:molecular chaperone GrpE (heat shock protein)